MDDSLTEAVRRKAWNSQNFHAPSFFERLPTMLTTEELRMLSFLARELPLDGVVLDLGCFVGGSTLALAHGIRNSSRPDRHIHSFDLFELNEAVKHRTSTAAACPSSQARTGFSSTFC
jgi:predicted O-methyltransferase YrrM